MPHQQQVIIYQSSDGKISVDTLLKDEKTIQFFQLIQNKLLWAISKQTSAELVHKRKPLMFHSTLKHFCSFSASMQ